QGGLPRPGPEIPP
uniref:Bradykinin-potentiating peptide 13b n=1 Tax=Bothrops jararaca TaxID=8724 RepID=BPPDB_BOTJA|nr:RecName: Full=Bradykinin-potentiating peptide 13b; Short=BPP-13b [Bothrops jararaca]